MGEDRENEVRAAQPAALIDLKSDTVRRFGRGAVVETGWGIKVVTDCCYLPDQNVVVYVNEWYDKQHLSVSDEYEARGLAAERICGDLIGGDDVIARVAKKHGCRSTYGIIHKEVLISHIERSLHKTITAVACASAEAFRRLIDETG